MSLAGGLIAFGAIAHGVATTTRAERQLRAVQHAWVQAEIHRDAGTLRRILDPAFIFTYEAGKPLRRDGFIHGIVSGKSRMLSQTLSETTVLIDGDTAIVAGLDTVRSIHDGKTQERVYRYTVTYVHRSGRWVALAEHMAAR